MNHDNLPILRRDQSGELSLHRANQMIEITDQILARARQELAAQDDSWMMRLWSWADENRVPDLKWVGNNSYKEGGFWRGFPRERQALLTLVELRLDQMGLTALPPEIAHLRHLQSLNLVANRITILPPEIGHLQKLQLLNLYSNLLTTLPPEIGQLEQLQTLVLEKNQLTSLPPEIGHLRQLQKLDVWGNQLQTLPLEISWFGQLQELNLWDNQLTTLPPEIGQLGLLKTLDLWHNQLTTLPPEIGQLEQLQTLVLHGNKLSALPPEIGQLLLLKKLRIDGHCLYLLPRALLLKENLVIDDENGCAIPMEERRRQVEIATPPQSLDGTRPRLIAERYRDNCDGSVTDVITGLQWKRCAEGQTWTGASCSGEASDHDWKDACGLRGYFAGHSDWRLPTINELVTLVYCSSGRPKIWNDRGNFCEGTFNSPTIQTEAFPNTPESYFWSSSPAAGSSKHVWGVFFDQGYVGKGNYGYPGEHVRLVRGRRGFMRRFA
jgi:hypothetical protein